jgi:hypothetical protein
MKTSIMTLFFEARRAPVEVLAEDQDGAEDGPWR